LFSSISKVISKYRSTRRRIELNEVEGLEDQLEEANRIDEEYETQKVMTKQSNSPFEANRSSGRQKSSFIRQLMCTSDESDTEMDHGPSTFTTSAYDKRKHNELNTSLSSLDLGHQSKRSCIGDKNDIKNEPMTNYQQEKEVHNQQTNSDDNDDGYDEYVAEDLSEELKEYLIAKMDAILNNGEDFDEETANAIERHLPSIFMLAELYGFGSLAPVQLHEKLYHYRNKTAAASDEQEDQINDQQNTNDVVQADSNQDLSDHQNEYREESDDHVYIKHEPIDAY
jgi:hypothetical protein